MLIEDFGQANRGDFLEVFFDIAQKMAAGPDGGCFQHQINRDCLRVGITREQDQRQLRVFRTKLMDNPSMGHIGPIQRHITKAHGDTDSGAADGD